jgi:exopolyphosphatase/guanosine-5'-triphosphate,3'-diphosphate pyrophosphatase
VATVADYAGQARFLGATTMLLLGTEAVRQAADATDLAGELHARTGLRLVVVDRSTEGLLTLLGVTGGRVPPSLAAIDIGGGSTEVTMMVRDGRPMVGIVPVGSAGLALAHIHHDPVTADEVARLREVARAQVATLDLPRPERAIVAGGSGTNVSRLLRRERTTRIDRAAIDDGFAVLLADPAAAIAARTGLTERRVAQLAAGLAIGEALFVRLGLDNADVSDASLREGALIAAWFAGQDWPTALPGIVAGRVVGPAPGGQDRAS